MNTLLSGATGAELYVEPFPHIVRAHALDDELCDELLAAFPALDVIADGKELSSNKRLSLPASKAMGHPAVAPIWRQLVEEHVSQGFLEELIELFGDDIRRLYPSFEEDHGSLDCLRSGIRRADDFDSADVLLDSQISVNTPVTGRPTSVRAAHLDDADKLFVGLLYLRHPDDRSTGGDLVIYRWKRRPRGIRGAHVYERYIEPVRTVPYARGSLIVFLNTPDALHGVTPRSRTDIPRYFMNFVGTVRSPLFGSDSYQATRWDRLLAGPEIMKRRLERVAGA